MNAEMARVIENSHTRNTFHCVCLGVIVRSESLPRVVTDWSVFVSSLQSHNSKDNILFVGDYQTDWALVVVTEQRSSLAFLWPLFPTKRMSQVLALREVNAKLYVLSGDTLSPMVCSNSQILLRSLAV